MMKVISLGDLGASPVYACLAINPTCFNGTNPWALMHSRASLEHRFENQRNLLSYIMCKFDALITECSDLSSYFQRLCMTYLVMHLSWNAGGRCRIRNLIACFEAHHLICTQSLPAELCEWYSSEQCTGGKMRVSFVSAYSFFLPFPPYLTWLHTNLFS